MATVVNASLSYLPTAGTAWLRVTGKQPAQWIDEARLLTMQQEGVTPSRGAVVTIKTPSDISGFSHRDELVYLPPVWFTSIPASASGGDGDRSRIQRPARLAPLRRGLKILDDFALRHRGAAPVVVFPDTSGSFTNDTECVNGPRGNAADHITKEVVPYLISHFGVNADAPGGAWPGGRPAAPARPCCWSNTPSCSAPSSTSTVSSAQRRAEESNHCKVFGGDSVAWAAFDPKTVVEAQVLTGTKRRGSQSRKMYKPRMSPPAHRRSPTRSMTGIPDPEDHPKTAVQLCKLFGAYRIECSVVGYREITTIPPLHGFANALPNSPAGSGHQVFHRPCRAPGTAHCWPRSTGCTNSSIPTPSATATIPA